MKEYRIRREDMLELTRRMTPARTSFTRIAGCYADEDGEFDGSFNVHFLKLSQKDKTKNLELAKTIPFARTNEELKRYSFSQESERPGSIRQLLLAIRECGLKNDALLDTFYDLFLQQCRRKGPYGILIFHDRYDVPVKAEDKERLGESEETYEYLICALCPLTGEYEPGKPEWGFLFPAFTDRSSDGNYVNLFHREDRELYRELDRWITGERGEEK